MNSSMAELIAPYSPPIPMPVRKRKKRERREVPRKSGEHGRDAVNGERDHEEPAPSETVGERTEDERSGQHSHRVDRIDPRRRRAAEMQFVRDVREHRTGDGRFEAVENPRDA